MSACVTVQRDRVNKCVSVWLLCGQTANHTTTKGNIYPVESALLGRKEAAVLAEPQKEDVTGERHKIAERHKEVPGERSGRTQERHLWTAETGTTNTERADEEEFVSKGFKR